MGKKKSQGVNHTQYIYIHTLNELFGSTKAQINTRRYLILLKPAQNKKILTWEDARAKMLTILVFTVPVT